MCSSGSMFCFCLQSSLLKLQALEVDGCSSLGPSPDSSPPPQTSPPPPLGGKDQTQTLENHQVLSHCCPGSFHSPSPWEENSPPAAHLALLPSPLNPQMDGGVRDPQSPGLLCHITDGNSPQPSPRCSRLSQSQRFNTDPETAPSPPCSQHFILTRGLGRAETSEEEEFPSIPLLSRHIHTLKKKIRLFEEGFEQEMNYKPSHNDKTADPEILKLMTELAKSRKQLKELKLKQSEVEMKGQKIQGEKENNDGGSEMCRYGVFQQVAADHQQQSKPSLEETVEGLLRRLREKRQDLGLPDNMKEMSQRQMALEKITLQKCLLYFESLHGRPGTKQERNLVKPLYDRYQTVKHLLCSTSPITTIEEEEGSDEDNIQQCPTTTCRVTSDPAPREEDSDRDSDPAFVSPLDEVKAVRQQPGVTMANLHEASRSELLEFLRETRKEKKKRGKALREFEEQFYKQTGRTATKDDRILLAEEYHEYKNLKAKLRLLEVLLSKQEMAKNI
ncbi:protein FAM13C isoform X2 [Esox lucius]|uniref:protein FAM13C isoform X2 n=1 Tax=Esox lucius TaxID=8010 RepID=UPI0014776C58|nr:protein FAM13C isoform X2 [Esox lucius]